MCRKYTQWPYHRSSPSQLRKGLQLSLKRSLSLPLPLIFIEEINQVGGHIVAQFTLLHNNHQQADLVRAAWSRCTHISAHVTKGGRPAIRRQNVSDGIYPGHADHVHPRRSAHGQRAARRARIGADTPGALTHSKRPGRGETWAHNAGRYLISAAGHYSRTQ
ncbi:hypothetical protein MRX96_016881 [Rhipicephalus microplus]